MVCVTQLLSTATIANLEAMMLHRAGDNPADLKAAGGEEDEHWDRKFGSGPAGTSAGAADSSGGRQRLEEQRTIFTNAIKRKAQVGQFRHN